MKKNIFVLLFLVVTLMFSFSFMRVHAKDADYFFQDLVYVQFFTEENIEEYDVYHLLSYDESIVLTNWLEKEYHLKINNEKDNEFIRDNLSKFVLLAMQKGIVTNYYDDSNVSILWASDETKPDDTHRFITSNAITILNNDGKTAVYNFFSPYISILKDYSIQPDIDESISGTHYYVYEGTPTTSGEYYKNNNGDYSYSARTRFEDYYSTAINAYKNGEHQLALEFLGRALHYLEDIGITLHSAGISDGDYRPFKPHKAYETWVNNNYNEFKVYSSSLYYYTMNNNFSTIINYLAFNSQQYGEYLNDCSIYQYPFCDDSNYHEITLRTLPYIQEIVAGILNRFYYEVNSSSTKYIKNGINVSIKAIDSGNVFDLSSYNNGTELVARSYSGNTNQQFVITFNRADGTFHLRPQYYSSKALTVTTNNVIELQPYSSTNQNQKFRFTYMYNGYYRIMTGGSDYRFNVFDSINQITQGVYMPDFYNQYWSIKEEQGDIIIQPFIYN